MRYHQPSECTGSGEKLEEAASGVDRLDDAFDALFALGRVYRRLVGTARLVTGGAECKPLSPLAFSVLHHLGQHQQSFTPSELADALLVARPNVSALIKELASRKLIMQVRTGERERRTVVSLSAQGQSLLEDIRRAHRQFFSGLLLPLSEDDLSKLATSARTLAGILDQVSPDA